MLKAALSNIILSEVDINSVKYFLGNAPILNIFYKLGSQALIDYKFPTHIFIETTRACNLKCQSCPRDLGNAKIGNMRFEVFRKIIDEATAFGAKNFCLHMFGEPLIHPEIIEMVRYIKDSNRNHSILLTTNGYFLSGAKLRGLLENGVDKIVVSLFSLKEDRLQELTGDDDIQKIIENVKEGVALKKQLKSKTKIFIRLLLCEKNEDEEKDFLALARDLGVIPEIRKTHNYSGIVENNYTSKHFNKKRYPCYHLWFSPAVSWDGKVLLCCSDWNYFEVLGDVNRQSLENIWQSERIKKLRRYHLRGGYNKIPLCENCNVWTMYPDIFFKFQKR